MVQQSVQQGNISHIAQSMFSVHDSLDCHRGGTTSSIHHDCSQHVQAQHKMPTLELINLKTSARFMKNSSSKRMKSPSLTFCPSAAAELFGGSNDESMCMFSWKRVDHSSENRKTKFHVQARHHGSGCSSLSLTGQVQGSLFFRLSRR